MYNPEYRERGCAKGTHSCGVAPNRDSRIGLFLHPMQFSPYRQSASRSAGKMVR